MDIGKQFTMTDAWSKKLSKDLKSYYRTVYLGPPIFAVINIFFCMSLQRGNSIGFWTLFIPITILSIIYCALLPQKAIKRYKYLIQTFEFKKAEEISLTFIDGATLILQNPKVIDGFLKIDKTEKPCKFVSNNLSKDYYTIIPEFFSQPIM